MKTTRYFEVQVLRKRLYLELQQCEGVIAKPLRRIVQEDGRIRYRRRVVDNRDGKSRALRVVTLDHGETIHNAFFDRDFVEAGWSTFRRRRRRRRNATPRPKPVVQHLLHRPGTRVGKSRGGKPRLRHSSLARLSVRGRQRLRQQRFQARIVAEMVFDAIALNADTRFPTRSALARLIAPLQKVQQEHFEAADQLTLFRAPHAVDFLGDVLDVRLR
jgi:hypothetical protein